MDTKEDDFLMGLVGYLFLGAITLGMFSPLLFAALPALLGIIGCGLYFRTYKSFPQIDYGIALSALGLCGLLIASSFWSITPAVSLSRAFKVGAIILLTCPLFFLCKDIPQQKLIMFKKWAIVPMLLTAVVLYIELAYNYPLTRFFAGFSDDAYISKAELNKHVSALLLMLPFAVVFSLRTRMITLPVLLIALCGLVLTVTESQAAQLAAALMLLAMPSLLLMPKAAPLLAFSGVAFLLIFMPWIGPVAFDAFAEPLAHKTSVIGQANIPMRLENWDFLGRRIMENPWTGYGVDTTRSMHFDTDQFYFKSDMILHPHNIALQIWIEFGVGGVIAALGFLFFLYRRLTALPFLSQILPFTLFCGVMVFLMVSWSIWASWLDGLVLWIMALLILVTKPKTVLPTS